MGQLEDMQTFVRVVEAGNIGTAAKQMGIAKSAVSRRLADLEEQLNMTLINRTTRSSKITDKGRQYYIRSLHLINAFTELDNITASPDCLLQGTIRISAPISFGISHLTPALDIFAKKHPDLSFDINLSNHKSNLIREGFDLGFRIDAPSDPSLTAQKIAHTRFTICASPEYLKQHGTPKTPNDLKDHQLLKLSFLSNDNWKFTDKKGEQYTLISPPKILSNNSCFIKNMAIKGHGIIRIATFSSWKSVKAGELVPMLQDYSLDERDIYAVYPQTRYLSRRARLLIDFLSARFEDNPYRDQT